MYRHLLAAAALGACAILPAPASAHGPGHAHAVSAFDFRIVLHDRPQVVHDRHPPRGYLRAQPWPPRFKHHSARPRWQHPPRHHTRHFWRHDNDHRRHFKWSRNHDRRHHFDHGQRNGRGHAPDRHRGHHRR